MQTNYLGKRIEYNYLKTADKHYFGGFLNLAKNNIEVVFSVFCERFKITPTNPISLINDQLKDDVAPSEYQKKVDFLKQYLPVIHYLDLEITNEKFSKEKDKEKAKRKYFKDNFIALIKAIECLRNFYTHHYHKPIFFDVNLFDLLDELFITVVFDVRKRKMKGDQTRHLLKKGLHSEIEELVKLKTIHLKELKKEGKRVNLDSEAIENAVFNDAFYHLLYKEGVSRNYQSKLISETENENNLNISESGLLFLLSIFLQRKENEQLRANIKGYKGKVIVDNEKPIDRNNNSLKFMATHWVFNYLSVKTIKHRLNTTFQKETLLIQIADELSKVPDALYQTFTKEQKEEFVEDVNEYLKDGDSSESLEKSIIIHPVIRKRYENKFNYFSLRFLDEFVNFPSLRFQIYLGNYVQDRRVKTISGTNYTTERMIKEKINVFGKLSEISQIKSDYFGSSNEDTHWEIFPNPSYNFVGNNIPIYINLEKSKVKGAGKLNGLLNRLHKKQEIKNRKENKPSKTEMISELHEGIIFGKPTAVLSMNEMQALLHEVLVNNKTGEEVEEILINKLIERYDTIINFDPNEPLPTSKITKKLRKSTNEIKIDTDKLLRAIESEIRVTNEKLCLIKNNVQELNDRQQKRKFVFTNKELGQEATWLADDIKRFMPKETKENWKGYQHSLLQELLAFYESKPKEAHNFLNTHWNIKDNNYPFNEWLVKAFQNNKFDRFYREYLSNRVKYFECLKTQISGFKNNRKLLNKFLKQQFVWSIFYKRLYVISTTENQKEQLLLKPLVFPRGIFDEKPTYIKGKNIVESPNLFADWYRFIQDKNQELQKFYLWERDYKELFEQHKIALEFSTNKYDLSEIDKFNLFKRKWDKKIKATIGQDLFLNLMNRKIIKDLYNHDVDLSLSDYYLTQKERIEKQNKALKQSQREKQDKSENIVKDDFIWSMTVSFKTEFIDEPSIKLKDVGKFTRFLNEEKVKRIFEYNTSKKWTKLEIEKELENYEKIRREEIFKLFQELEEKILEENKFDGVNHPNSFMQNGNPNFKKYITQGFLIKDKSLKKEDVEWIEGLKDKGSKNTFESNDTIKELQQKPEKIKQAFMFIYLRNKFAHNQLPIKTYFDMICPNFDTTKSITEHIFNYLKLNRQSKLFDILF